MRQPGNQAISAAALVASFPLFLSVLLDPAGRPYELPAHLVCWAELLATEPRLVLRAPRSSGKSTLLLAYAAWRCWCHGRIAAGAPGAIDTGTFEAVLFSATTEQALELMARFRAQAERFGTEIVDVDVTTSARPDEIEAAVDGWADSVWLQGQRFGTVGAQKDGETFEITTFRADVYHPESRKPDVTYSDDIETDLSRRDFTINAMALALDDPDLVDPFGGLADLAQRRLRTPQSPELSFGDDPLRMLRAARFVSALGFEPDAALVEAMTAIGDCGVFGAITHGKLKNFPDSVSA